MKNPLLILVFLIVQNFTHAQSKTTEALSKKYGDAMALYFYNNTLRMINQSEDKDFDALIKDIEKMKFLMINKGNAFDKTEYKKIVSGYKSEFFEEMMTSRHEGKNFDVYIREKQGHKKGMVILVNDSTNLYVLDILGSIPLNKVTSLYKTIGQSSEIGDRIKAFVGEHNNEKLNRKN